MWPQLIEGIKFPRTFGVIVMLGALLSIWTAGRRARRQGYDQERVWDFSVGIVLAGILGARLGDVLVNWHNYWGPYEARDVGLGDFLISLIAIWQPGMQFSGGVVLAVLVGVVLVRRWGLPLGEWIDLMCPSFAWALAATSLAHFCQGSVYGLPTNQPWGMAFPAEALAYSSPLIHIPEGTTLHPVQIYLLLGYILIGFWLARHFPAPRRGTLFCDFLWLSGLLVFITEEFRADVEVGNYLSYSLTVGQLFAVGIFLTALSFRIIFGRPEKGN